MVLEKINIGIDIVDVVRFRKILFSKKSSFYKKMFLPSEIKYCLRFKNSYEHFAGKFAIKEAVKKAIDESISMLEIETFHNNSQPKVKLKGKLKDRYLFLVSLSHDKNLVVGIVISEKVENNTKKR